MPRQLPLTACALATAFVLVFPAACGDSNDGAPAAPSAPAIARTEGTPVPGAAEWTWVPFPDATCTDAIPDDLGRYRFGTSTTGLAINWGPSADGDLVIFLQGGGACWEFFTCGGAAPILDKTASTGPFGPTEFARDVYDRYPRSWLLRSNLPLALRDATVVFIPYCTGDVHGGDRVATYASLLPGAPSITWHHVGHANVLAFLKRLAPTFPRPRKLVVSGASAGGFGSLVNYASFRAQWPDARGYLVDDSGPPLVADAIPAPTRSGWYASWNLGASLDGTCPGCRQDMSGALRDLAARYPSDRIALVSHLRDEVIRAFYATLVLAPTPSLSPMPGDTFEAELRRLGTTVMDPATSNAKYFFTAGDGHPTLDDPAAIISPSPGLTAWLELMLSDSPAWASAADPQ
jgi:hypothetical protein